MEDGPRQVCDDLMRLLEAFKQATLRLAEEHKLTRMQVWVLHLIDDQKEVAMGQLAGSLHCDASNVTGIIDRLVAQKLVSRQELASDRRTKTLRLTSKGTKIVADLKAELPLQLGCSKLTRQEVQALHSIAAKLA